MSRVSADGILWFERKGSRRVVTSKEVVGWSTYYISIGCQPFCLGSFQSFVANGKSTVYIERIPAPEVRLQVRNKLLHSIYVWYVCSKQHLGNGMSRCF